VILGLHGLPGSGKDAFVERAALYSKYPVVRHAFADKMKASICGLLSISLERLEGLKRSDDPCLDLWGVEAPDGLREFTMREFIQRYGTEAHRDVFGQDFWVDQCLPLPRVMSVNDIHNNPYAGKLTIVTDIRFPNEAQRVQMLGGKIVEMLGPDDIASEHRSDRHIGVEYINYKIHNQARDDDFALLDSQIELLLAHLGVRRVSSDEATTSSVSA
jgi:hypothetical protein